MIFTAALAFAFTIISTGSIIREPLKLPTRSYVRGCYYTNWSQYRPGLGRFLPENYQPGLCTHLFYAFAVMDDNYTLSSSEWNDKDRDGAKGMYTRVNTLKQQQPDLKTVLSFGGFAFSRDNGRLIRQMVTKAQNRHAFIQSVTEFVRQAGFDGFNIDWQYPDLSTKGSFSALIQEMHIAFIAESKKTGRSRLLLTASVSAEVERISAAYDGEALAKWLDFIKVTTYDFAGPWDRRMGYSSPLIAYFRNDSLSPLSVSGAMGYWNINQGVPKEKLLVGFPAYSRAWSTTSFKKQPQPGDLADGPLHSQPFTREKGLAAYYEVCTFLKSGRFFSVSVSPAMCQLVYNEKTWLVFENVGSYREKIDWLMENDFGGAFVWALDMDDFLGRCYSSAGIRYPLISTIQTKFESGYAMPLDQPFRCPKPGYYADPKSCSSYYRCDGSGIAYKLKCPNGQLFSYARLCVKEYTLEHIQEFASECYR